MRLFRILLYWLVNILGFVYVFKLELYNVEFFKFLFYKFKLILCNFLYWNVFVVV